jgi:4-amino-4-deoxy-L-arabinose transferase-like glycosyltransferase
LLAIVIVIAVAAVACAFGMRLLAAARTLQSTSLLERAVFGAGIGLGALAYLVLAIGLLGWLYWWAMLAIVVSFAAIAWRELGSLVAGAGRGIRQFFSRQASIGGVAVTAFLLVMILLAVLGALAPSSVNDWDGLSYHLAVPKLYLQAHAIHYIGWLSHSNFPFTMEMLYSLGLALGGQGGAKLFDTLCGVLVLLAMVAFAASHWERRHGALAALVFLSAPVIAWEATSGLNDLAAALFTLLSLYAFVNWWSGRGEGWLAVAGVLCGFDLGIKATALALAGFLVVAALYHRIVTERAGTGAGLRTAGLFLLITIAVALPWYVKAYVWTGNPVYPFLYNIFGGKYWTPEAARLYREEQLGFGMGHSLPAFLLGPWNLTMHGNMFSNFPTRPLMYTAIGPLFLALLPGLLLLGRPDRRVKFLLIYCLAGYTAWFVLSQHIRYAIPFLPAVALCAGYAGSEIARKAAKELRPVAIGAILLVCMLSLAIFVVLVAESVPVALGMESQAAYLTRTLDGLYTMAQEINALPSGSKVIMYGETRGFYFDTPYMWGNHHHNMIPYERLENVDQLMASYRALGVTHVLMTGSFMQAVRQGRGKLAELLDAALRSKRLVPIAIRGDLILLRIAEPVA